MERLQLPFVFAKPLPSAGQQDFFLLPFEAGQKFLRGGVELRPLHVVTRFHQVGLRLLLLDLVLGLCLSNLLFGLLQLRELLRVRALHRHRIEADHHVPLFDIGAVLRQLENLKVSRR